jgi:hypothetical protein
MKKTLTTLLTDSALRGSATTGGETGDLIQQNCLPRNLD